MADLLQRLIVAATVCAGLASAAGFSHKQHLTLGLACTKCHVSAPASTKATDNLLPAASACHDCHEAGVTPRATPTPVFVAKFNHALHVKLFPANPCKTCHRGLEQSDRITAVNFPAMSECLICHNKIDPPFSCMKCHTGQQQLKPANHTADFIDTHSSGKLNLDKTTCALCHGRRFTCQGCH